MEAIGILSSNSPMDGCSGTSTAVVCSNHWLWVNSCICLPLHARSCKCNEVWATNARSFYSLHPMVWPNDESQGGVLLGQQQKQLWKDNFSSVFHAVVYLSHFAVLGSTCFFFGFASFALCSRMSNNEISQTILYQLWRDARLCEPLVWMWTIGLWPPRQFHLGLWPLTKAAKAALPQQLTAEKNHVSAFVSSSSLETPTMQHTVLESLKPSSVVDSTFSAHSASQIWNLHLYILSIYYHQLHFCSVLCAPAQPCSVPRLCWQSWKPMRISCKPGTWTQGLFRGSPSKPTLSWARCMACPAQMLSCCLIISRHPSFQDPWFKPSP